MACDCREVKDLKKVQREHFEIFPLIFVGAVDQLNDDGTYTFKLIELFKGNPSDSLIHGKPEGYCYSAPRESDYMWLVYATPNDDGSITIESCSLSRSYYFPYISNEKVAVPPPSLFYNDNEDKTIMLLEAEIATFDYKERALNVLRAEIEQLRRWRDKKGS